MFKTEFFSDVCDAINPARSQSFGRRLYCVDNGRKKTWVKQQLAHVNIEYERGFFNELEIYTRLNHLKSSDRSILGHFSIVDIPIQRQKSDLNHVEWYLGQALCVEHAEALFAKSALLLSQRDVWSVLEESLNVLNHLHQLQFIHGDLKAEHFRFTDSGAILIDFEQSGHIDEVSHFPNTATPRYMAPELFHGQLKSYASDIYALGIVWLEWLTGRKLSANSYYDWAVLHCQQLQVDLCVEHPSILSLLQKMLAKQKIDRFQTISEIQQALTMR